MNHHDLLMQISFRHQGFDSPELARRRENLSVFERETREARPRRGSETIRRNLHALAVVSPKRRRAAAAHGRG
jgi:hypothetical protein